jgi:hypothetical protein
VKARAGPIQGARMIAAWPKNRQCETRGRCTTAAGAASPQTSSEASPQTASQATAKTTARTTPQTTPGQIA